MDDQKDLVSLSFVEDKTGCGSCGCGCLTLLMTAIIVGTIVFALLFGIETTGGEFIIDIFPPRVGIF